jgi:hypothetical protein
MAQTTTLDPHWLLLQGLRSMALTHRLLLQWLTVTDFTILAAITEAQVKQYWLLLQ